METSKGYCGTVATPTWSPSWETHTAGNKCIATINSGSVVDNNADLCSCTWGQYPCECPGPKCGGKRPVSGDGGATSTDTTKGTCKTAHDGSSCYEHVKWAMLHGLRNHPDWYVGLSEKSTVQDFQLHLTHHGVHHECNRPPCPCKDLSPGEDCYVHVKWAMTTGITKNPTWYPGLTKSSSFREFQDHLASDGHHDCPAACYYLNDLT